MIEPSNEFHYDWAYDRAVDPAAPFHDEAVHRPDDQFRSDAGVEWTVDVGPAYCHHIMMTYDTGPVADEPIVVMARVASHGNSDGAVCPVDPAP
jgi:hypothetical protein